MGVKPQLYKDQREFLQDLLSVKDQYPNLRQYIDLKFPKNEYPKDKDRINKLLYDLRDFGYLSFGAWEGTGKYQIPLIIHFTDNINEYSTNEVEHHLDEE